MAFVYIVLVLYGIFHLYQQWRIERIENNMVTKSEFDAAFADFVAKVEALVAKLQSPSPTDYGDELTALTNAKTALLGPDTTP